LGLISHKCSSAKQDSFRGTAQNSHGVGCASKLHCAHRCGLLIFTGYAQNAGPDLSELSLDSLSNTEITSVARKAEKLSQAAAAIFVISQEDIRRSARHHSQQFRDAGRADRRISSWLITKMAAAACESFSAFLATEVISVWKASRGLSSLKSGPAFCA